MTEREVSLVAACSAVETKIAALAARMQEVDRRDHRLMITLRDKYQVPQAMLEMADAYSALMSSLRAYSEK